MAQLEEIREGVTLEGIIADSPVTVVHVKWFGGHALELTYKIEETGTVGNRLLYRSDEEKLRIIDVTPTWAFDGDGEAFRLIVNLTALKREVDLRIEA